MQVWAMLALDAWSTASATNKKAMSELVVA